MESSVHGSRRGMGMVMLAAALWGTSGIASQIISQMAATTPLSLSFLRMLIAAPVLLLAGQRLLGQKMWAISRRDFAMMMLTGTLVAVDYALYFAAISYAGVAVATLVTICTAPVLVNVFTALFYRRRPDNLTLFSVALAVAGTMLLVGGSQNAAPENVSLTGVLLALAAAGIYACIVFCGRYMAGRCHPLQVNAVAFSTGAVVLALGVSVAGFAGDYPPAGWGVILYLGLVPTALAYSLFIVGMRSTSAPVASVLTLLEPLTAALLSWLFLPDEKPGLAGIAGAVMLLAAIYLLSRRETSG
jgi:drug/metabolite transporter, DME family